MIELYKAGDMFFLACYKDGRNIFFICPEFKWPAEESFNGRNPNGAPGCNDCKNLNDCVELIIKSPFGSGPSLKCMWLVNPQILIYSIPKDLKKEYLSRRETNDLLQILNDDSNIEEKVINILDYLKDMIDD